MKPTTVERKIHVGFDVDGVLRDYPTYLLECYGEDHPEHRKHFCDADNLDDWDFRKNMIVFDKDVWNHFFEYAFQNGETGARIFRNAPAHKCVSRFSKYYEMLKRAGCQVSICTNQVTYWQQLATIQWLQEHKIPYDSVILCGFDKSCFGLDYLIDDHINNIVAVDSCGGQGVLLERVYNVKELNRVKHSVASVEEYIDFVLEREMQLL